MAEPESPRSDENGNGEQNNRLDRDTTRLRGPMKPNMALAVTVCGAILVGGLWYVLSSEEDGGRAGRPRSVDPQEPAVILVPRDQPQPPPATPALQPRVAPAPGPPPVDPLAEQRARLLLARIQRLQKEMDQRRRSKMLVVSDSSSARPGPTPAALAAGQAPGPGVSPAALTGAPADNTPRVGNVGPVAEQVAVQARLLRTTGYTITEGTVIPGVLETAINSDLPGIVRAINSADVFSHDGTQLLIPKGTRLVGRYQSELRRGQVRIFIMWTRLIRADGLSVLINSPGTDPLGRAGLEGDVDTHFFQIFGAAILLSILDGGLDVALEMARRQGDNSDTTIIRSDRGMDRAAEIALQDSIRIQPTIHIDQGTRISILVARDLDFEGVEMARAAAQGK